MRQAQQTLGLLSLLLVVQAVAGCAWFETVRFQPQLDRADAAFNNGDIALAATLYESLADRYPASPRRERLLMRQGMAYYTLASYHDAQDVFLGYLNEFPSGAHRDEARVYLEKLAVLQGDRSPADAEALGLARQDLHQLEELRVDHPYDPAVAMALGNLYYEMGNYEDAMNNYYRAVKLDAALEERLLIQQRVIFDEDGNPVPRTPGAVDQLMRERRPLVIFHTHDYKSRDLGSTRTDSRGDLAFYNVTGLVRNQSDRLLHRVSVQVQFKNMYGALLDVRSFDVGSMGPGEVRPFRVESSAYDNLYNIASYVCTVYWDETDG